MKKLGVCCWVWLVLGTGLGCADDATRREAVKGLPQPTGSAAQIQLAERLVEVLKAAPLCEVALHGIAGEAVAVEPRLAGMERDLVDFLEEHMGWDTLKPAVIGLYVAAFSEEDLSEIVRFYESDAGGRFVERSLDIGAGVMELVGRRFEAAGDDCEILLAQLLRRAEAK